jgi:hypothetical protein
MPGLRGKPWLRSAVLAHSTLLSAPRPPRNLSCARLVHSRLTSACRATCAEQRTRGSWVQFLPGAPKLPVNIKRLELSVPAAFCVGAYCGTFAGPDLTGFFRSIDQI